MMLMHLLDVYKRQDQENDYKITHLADSFEEFIRGLEHESLYDPDEDVEGLEDDACLLYTSFPSQMV